MALKKFVVNNNTNTSLQADDKIVSVGPGVNEGDGITYVIERDVPDAPTYYPSVVGTATIENKFGVLVPGLHGVWVETAKKMFFRVFSAKNAEQAVFPARRVVAFEADPTPDVALADMARQRGEQKERADKAERRVQRAESALRSVHDDMLALRKADRPMDVVMVSAIGLNMQAHLASRGGVNDG